MGKASRGGEFVVSASHVRKCSEGKEGRKTYAYVVLHCYRSLLLRLLLLPLLRHEKTRILGTELSEGSRGRREIRDAVIPSMTPASHALRLGVG